MSVADFDQITVKGEKLSLVVGPGLTGFDENQLLDGSPNLVLTVHDGRDQLVSSGVFDSDGNGKLDAEVDMVDADGTRYRMGQVRKTSRDYELTMELYVVSVLRDQKGSIRIARDTLSHVDFAHRLVRDAGDAVGADFGFITGAAGPEESAAQAKAQQKIEAAQTRSQLRIAEARARADRRRERGIADNARLTVKNSPASAAQRHVMEVVLTEAERHNPSPNALLALIEACTVENSFSNGQGLGADAVSFGVLQNIPGTSVGIDGVMTRTQALDIAYCVRSALLPPGPTSKGGLIKLTQQHPDWTPGHVAAVAINGGGDPDYAAKCDGWATEAQKTINAFTGGDSVPHATAGTTVTQQLLRRPQLTRGTQDAPDEDSWTCMRRIAALYGYRCFAIGSDVYYISDEALMRSRPHATISEGTQGVDTIDWEWTPRKAVNTSTITCRAESWQTPAGAVVVLDDTDLADGRWLVSTYRRSRFQPTATVEVIRGTDLLKPRAPLVSFTISTRVPGVSGVDLGSVNTAGVPEDVLTAYAEAVKIGKRNYPYVWGGGHTHAGTPDGGTGRDPGIGYDCSGYTIAQLAAAKMGYAIGDAGTDSTGLETWGEPGEGHWMTVWANAGHVWVQYKIPGAAWRADTSPQGDGPDGPHVRRTSRTTDGFTPRHWRGR